MPSYASVQQGKEYPTFYFVYALVASPKLNHICLLSVRQRTPGWGELADAYGRGEIKVTQKCFQLRITLVVVKTGMFGACCGILRKHTCTHIYNCALGLALFFFVFLNQLLVSGVRSWLLVSHRWKGINTRQKDWDRSNPSVTCLDSWQQMLVAESHSNTYTLFSVWGLAPGLPLCSHAKRTPRGTDASWDRKTR